MDRLSIERPPETCGDGFSPEVLNRSRPEIRSGRDETRAVAASFAPGAGRQPIRLALVPRERVAAVDIPVSFTPGKKGWAIALLGEEWARGAFDHVLAQMRAEPPNGFRRIRAVAQKFAEATGVPAEIILGPSRTANVVAVRFLAILVVRYSTKLSLDQIGAGFHRDHTSILHGIRRAETALGLPPTSLDARRCRRTITRDCVADYLRGVAVSDICTTRGVAATFVQQAIDRHRRRANRRKNRPGFAGTGEVGAGALALGTAFVEENVHAD